MRNSVELTKGIILADIIKRQRGLCTVKYFSFETVFVPPRILIWDIPVVVFV